MLQRKCYFNSIVKFNTPAFWAIQQNKIPRWCPEKRSWLVFGPASNSSLNGFSKEYVLMFHPEEQSVSVKKITGQHKKFMTQWSEVMTQG